MITITIKTDNAAFQDGGRAAEVARILAWLSGRVGGVGRRFPPKVYDSNGNVVGTVVLTGKDRKL